MGEHPTTTPIYVPGRTERETTRLQPQARMQEPFTRRLFETAGLKEGMKVLDAGCGAGDVTLLAAEPVGPLGSVVGCKRQGDTGSPSSFVQRIVEQ